jgi:hypothetical protein
VISLDVERVAGIIGRISEANPALGRTLAQYAARYDYSTIFQTLQSAAAVRA